jgi:O-antigen/teichoic acid export membrane protein
MLNKLKPKSEFSRNVLTLVTGTTIAQAIPIAISPILTRIYTPEDFGLFALYMSILMIFGSLVAGKYELAILIPKNDNDAKTIVLFSILLGFINSLLLLIIIVLFHDKILHLLNNNSIDLWLYLLPLNIFIVSTSSILYYWKNRNKKYKLLSNNQIIQSFTQGSTNLLSGYFANLNFGLIIGTILGGFSSVIYLFVNSINDFMKFKIDKTIALSLMNKYKKFPKFMLPSGLLENSSGQLPVFLLGSFFGSAIVGYYALSQRIIRLPIMLIGTSIGNVFRQEASKHLNENGNCREIFKNTFKKLFLISTIPFFIFYFISPILFSLVFGEKWQIAGEYAQILTPMFYLQFLVSPLSNMFMIAEKQQYDLLMQVYLAIFVFGAFIIGYKYFESVKISLVLFTIVYSLKYIYELIMSYQFTIRKV